MSPASSSSNMLFTLQDARSLLLSRPQSHQLFLLSCHYAFTCAYGSPELGVNEKKTRYLAPGFEKEENNRWCLCFYCIDFEFKLWYRSGVLDQRTATLPTMQLRCWVTWLEAFYQISGSFFWSRKRSIYYIFSHMQWCSPRAVNTRVEMSGVTL